MATIDQILILLAPFVEALLKFLVRDVIPLRGGCRFSAAGTTKVLPVGIKIQTKGASVAANVGCAFANLDV